MKRADFSEVGHTGGKLTFHIECDESSRVHYSTEFVHATPRPSTVVAIYARRDGTPCATIGMPGMGQQFSPPPFPDCIAVILASDSEGRFGHECPRCHKHFRSSAIPTPIPLNCPYCGLRAASFHFLTPPQRAYVSHFVEQLLAGIESVTPGSSLDVVIDMDKVADAAASEPRPDFYYTSTTQQTQFRCSMCDEFNDIRGKYGYCADCGWRNNLASVLAALLDIRERTNNGKLMPPDAVKQSVSEFDAFGRNFVDELARRSPMKAGRRLSLQRLLFHNVDKVNDLLLPAFDIDLVSAVGDEAAFVRQMFHRRHVYEHDGGVATANYLEKTKDITVQEGALIRESVENVSRLITCIARMSESLDSDFHEMFPPVSFGIDLYRERKKRLKQRNS